MGVELDDSIPRAVAPKLNEMIAATARLETTLSKHDFPSTEEHMQYCATEIRPLMDEVRAAADSLEGYVSDELWPLPKYQAMLFIK